MNCPVCGKEMEKGHVITKNSIGLFFMPGEKDLRTFYTRRNIEADGGIVLDGPMTFRYNRTWLCRMRCSSSDSTHRFKKLLSPPFDKGLIW